MSMHPHRLTDVTGLSCLKRMAALDLPYKHTNVTIPRKHTNRTTIGPPAKRHSYGVSWCTDRGPILYAGLLASLCS